MTWAYVYGCYLNPDHVHKAHPLCNLRCKWKNKNQDIILFCIVLNLFFNIKKYKLMHILFQLFVD